MTDYLAAEIHIGGTITRSVAAALCRAINESGAALDWSGGRCRMRTPDDLLAARSPDLDETLVLKLCDDEAPWGEFDSLESFLRQHGVAYRRWSEAPHECDAEVEAFHPQCGRVSWLINQAGKPIVLASRLVATESRLTELLERMKHGEPIEVVADIENIRDALRAELPPAVPDLEPLEVVED